MRNTVSLIIAIGLSLSSFGWGETGHRAIGEVAENHLSEKAKKALQEIMGHESLAEASTWMDEIRSDKKYDYAKPWHYVTIPEGKDYHTADHAEGGDAYEAIGRMKQILMNEETSIDEKRDAIRMLTHLVGDFHQPLHVGNGEDRGGNNIKIKWFYDDSNLHRIWDSEIIDQKKLSFSELAEMVDYQRGEANSMEKSTDLDVWVKEAMQLRPQVYKIGEKDYLSYEYMYHNWPTIKDQLYKAGIRLAAILNEVYG